MWGIESKANKTVFSLHVYRKIVDNHTSGLSPCCRLRMYGIHTTLFSSFWDKWISFSWETERVEKSKKI